jgi:hypothetical protein
MRAATAQNAAVTSKKYASTLICLLLPARSWLRAGRDIRLVVALSPSRLPTIGRWPGAPLRGPCVAASRYVRVSARISADLHVYSCPSSHPEATGFPTRDVRSRINVTVADAASASFSTRQTARVSGMSPIPGLRRGVKGRRVTGPVGPAEPRPATGSTDLKHVVNLNDDELARVNKLRHIVEDR